MLTLLNPGGEKSRQEQTVKVTPKVKIFKIKGRNFALDENSLNVWQFNDELIDKLDFTSLASDHAPLFPYCSQDYRHKSYLVFQATYACNLKCRYCFVEKHYCDHTNTLKLEDAIKALDIYQPNWSQFGHKIGFFGGEPLLNWELIYNLTNFINNRIKDPAKKGYHITSNGTLLTEEMADFCAKNSYSWIISIDGPEGPHNESRPYRNFTGNSWQDTMRALKFLKKAYESYGGCQGHITLRGTFDRHGANFVERLEFLNNLCDEGYGGHVSVEPSCLAESCASETMEDLTREELRAQFYEQYMESAEWYAKRTLSGKFASFHHISSFLRRLQEHDIAVHECGAGMGYLSIGPNGKVCACHREHGSEIGSVNNIDKIQQETWMDNRLYARAKCPTCPIRYACGGGCRCNSMLVYGNLKVPTTAECSFREMQIEACLLTMALLKEAGYSKPELQQQYQQNQQQQNQYQQNQQQQNQQQQNQQCSKKQPQSPPCGLKFCRDNQCPFPSCGPQPKDLLEKVRKELGE